MKGSIVAATFALIAALALAGCSQTPNPSFCCTTEESCASKGATFPNGCEGNLVCDGANFTCVDPGNGGHCDSSEQCLVSSPITPFCVDHTCKQCDMNKGCSTAKPVCASDNVCDSCTTEADCLPYKTAGDGHCGATGACVECRDTQDCTTDPDKPVCEMGACRGCQSDAECDSMTCDKTAGACVAESSIIYLSPTGTSTGPCAKTAPCGTFAAGIAQLGGPKTVIKAMPGTYTGEFALAGKIVSIYGEGATVTSSAGNQPIILVSNGSDVTIDGLHITNAIGGGNPPGVQCTSSGTAPTLRIRRALVDHNIGGGINIYGCNFALVNNIIVTNGTGAGVIGGVSIGNITGGTPHTFEFNTVTGNSGGGIANSGVDCVQVNTSLHFANNIVFGNAVVSGKQVGTANCSWDYSDISDTVTGTNNITSDPMFMDAAGGNFHLMPTSGAIDHADPAATLGIDYDGDVRPKGAGRDIGADEAK